MTTRIAYFVVLIGALGAQPALSQGNLQVQNTDQQFTLLCKATAYGQILTTNLVIDYGRNTVNGTSAWITNNMIQWETKGYESSLGRVAKTHYELNRLSGTYRNWTDDVIYTALPPTYICEKAPPPKF